MLYSADFRARARMALAGKWMTAVLAGLIFGLLTGSSSLGGPKLDINFQGDDLNASFELFGQTILSTADQHPRILAFLAVNAVLIFLVILVLGVVYGVIGSTVSVGYARFNLDLTDGQTPELGTLFSFFPRMKTAFCAHFLRSLYTFLWTLLFIIPGVLARLDYAVVDYILAEHPDMTASEALTASKGLMYGNRWRLFCLQWSFLGWSILSGLTLGIGNLWLTPYQQAAYAAFYRNLR